MGGEQVGPRRVRVPEVAKRQGGVFTADQARAEHFTDRQVRRRIQAGHWRPVAGRAFGAGEPRPGARAPAWSAFQLGMAASLTVPRAVVSHQTAAAMHGFPVPDDACAHVIAHGRHGRVRDVSVHRLRLTDHETEETRGGLLVTTQQRTALDLLGVLTPGQALDLWAWLSTRQVLVVDELRTAVEERRGWTGTPALRSLLDFVADGAVSVAERRLHELLRAARIGGWEAGVTLSDGAGVIGVVDVLFRSAALVIEVDGFGVHSSQKRFVADRRKQNRLTAGGYRVLRFTWDDLTRRPDDVVARVRDLLRARA